MDFTQDDAYISYRYVANFINGDGLVFNIGERVEGFTNFGWVIYLIFWAKLGFDYLLISKISGFIFGGGVIVLTYYIAIRIKEFSQYKFLPYIAVTLVGITQSLAYWSIAGLETAAFAFFTLLSIYFYLKQSRLLIFSILITVLLRPEGALIAGILIFTEFATNRKFPRFSFTSALYALILSLPYVIFKLVYYGLLLPNSFYAKTGFSMTQLSNGLEYTGRFMTHYGFFGVPILLSLIFYKKLSKSLQTILIFTIVYLLYITLIGGDVLKVHRFFLPLFGLYAILSINSLMIIFQKLQSKPKQIAIIITALMLCWLTYFLPNNFVKGYNKLEKGFVKKMSFLAENIKKNDDSNFSAALPTIGVFSYKLIGHQIIDMLGLTDSTIARHSEEPIPGMVTTWKEGKHNSKYILTAAPDYILFSTGPKPSAPAEKSLMLYPRFIHSYNPLGWFYSPNNNKRGSVQFVFKLKDSIAGELKPSYPLAFVDYYKAGMEAYGRKNYQQAINLFDKALKKTKSPYFNTLLYHKALCHLMLKQANVAIQLFDYMIEQDSSFYPAHKEMYINRFILGETQKAEIHRKKLIQIVPWIMPQVDSIIAEFKSKMNR